MDNCVDNDVKLKLNIKKVVNTLTENNTTIHNTTISTLPHYRSNHRTYTHMLLVYYKKAQQAHKLVNILSLFMYIFIYVHT